MQGLFLCLLLAVVAAAKSMPESGYSLGVRSSIMVAHSFNDEEFGPAQQMHGATYMVDVDFETEDLAKKLNWVIDIGAALDMLGEVLKAYNFKNLNEVFPEENTTTEFMCKVIHKDLAEKLKCKNWKGGLRVKLHESHNAWATYHGEVE